MFTGNKAVEEYVEFEKNEAKSRYLDAISASVQGTGIVVLQRKVKRHLC